MLIRIRNFLIVIALFVALYEAVNWGARYDWSGPFWILIGEFQTLIGAIIAAAAAFITIREMWNSTERQITVSLLQDKRNFCTSGK